MQWPLSANFDKLISHTSGSLPNFGVRSEASEKYRPFFRSFEANSQDWNSGDYLTKMNGKMDIFTAAAVESSKVRQTPSTGKAAYKIPLSGLLNSGEKYYWRVKAQDETGLWSDWSKTGSFVPTGMRIPKTLRLEETANMLTLAWDTNTAGEKADFFELYGSDEKGFTPSKTEYDVVSSTYYDNIRGVKPLTRKFPPNFITTVKENRYTIFNSDNSEQARPYAYYRVVAVGADGSISGPSDVVEICRPFIYSKPTYDVSANIIYEYQLKSVCSIGNLQSIPTTQTQSGGSSVNRYMPSFQGEDNLHFSLMLAPDWLKIEKRDASTARIHGKPQKHNNNGSTWVITLVNDDFMNFDIQTFKIQGNYGNNYLKFIKDSLGFTYKYLQTKSMLKISGPLLRLKRIYWNIHNRMPLGY